MKMSKSNPDSAVFIHDDPDTIRRKVSRAFCPRADVSFNPVLDWVRQLVFTPEREELVVDRPQSKGGRIRYPSYRQLEDDFLGGRLHPLDVKSALAEALIERLEPARRQFARRESAAQLAELDALMGDGAGSEPSARPG